MKSTNLSRVVLLAGLALAACTPISRPALPTAQCTYNSDCQVGQICGPSGSCIAQCKEDRDCAEGFSCNGGACAALAGHCAQNTDCDAGMACGSGGLCSSTCVLSTDCGPNHQCLSGVCYLSSAAQCVRNSDCSDGQACVAGVCSAACIDARDCPVGAVCNGGFCTLPAPQCFAASDCDAGQACSPSATCVGGCNSTGDCIGAGVVCSAGACVATGPTTAAIQVTALLNGQANSSGTLIALSGAGYATAVTPTSGVYTFEGLPPGRYSVALANPYTVEQTQTIQVGGQAGSTTQPPAVVFTPAGSISGQALLQGQSSSLGITVFAQNTSVSATTDNNGNFTLSGLPVGTYSIIATYTGFTPAEVTNVSVTFKQTTALSSPLQLIVPASNNTSFAFSSIPPSTAVVGKSYVYTAAAGGPGISSVTYAVAAGPSGLSIDPSFGTVSYIPNAFDYQNSPFLIAFSATGGSATVYQTYQLTVTGPYATVSPYPVVQIAADGGVLWATDPQDAVVTRMVGNNSPTLLASSLGASTGSIGALDLMNGGTISSIAYAGGKLTGISGPFGKLSTSSAGGVIASRTGKDAYTVSTSSLAGGRASSLSVTNGNQISAEGTYLHPVSSWNLNEQIATGIQAPTGAASAVATTVLTDSAGTWGVNSLSGCLDTSDGNHGGTYAIASNTATTITVSSGDLTQAFVPGNRYFITNCSNSVLYTVQNSGAAYTPATLEYLDIYIDGTSYSDYYIQSNTATAISFYASPTQYSSLINLPTSGFYATTVSSYLTVTLTDSTASYTPGALVGTYVAFGDSNNYWGISANTATTITFQPYLTTLTEFGGIGEQYRLIDSNYNTGVALTMATGGYTAGALVGQYLYLDALGLTVPITANTSTTITAGIPYSQISQVSLVGSEVAVVSSSSMGPTMVLTDSVGGLTPNAWEGLYLIDVGSDGPQTIGYPDPKVVGNTATTVSFQLAPYYCSNYCYFYYSNELKTVLTELSTDQYSVTDNVNNGATAQFELTVSPTTGAADSMAGRAVAIDSAPTNVATIAHNNGNALTVDANENSYQAFLTLAPGKLLQISDSSSQWVMTLSDAAASWTANQWTNYQLVVQASGGGIAVGTVISNTANSFQVAITDEQSSYDLQYLTVGTRYTFGVPTSAGTNCNWVDVTATLPGATLTPNAYSTLTYTNFGTASFDVYSNDASSAHLHVCPYQWGSLLSGAGDWATLSFSGQVSIALQDSAANYTVNGLVGDQVSVANGPTQSTLPVASNTAKSISVTLPVDTWLNDLAASSVQTGDSYAVTNATGGVPTTITVAGSLTAGALANHVVALHSKVANDTVNVFVSANATTTMTVSIPPSYLPQLIGTGSDTLDRYTTSAGAVLRVTDGAAAFSPGALVGRTLLIDNYQLEILSNTATQIVGATSDSSAVSNTRGAPSYQVLGLNPGGPIVALHSGEAWVAQSQGSQIWKLGASTLNGTITSLGTATPLTATPLPGLTGTFSSTGNLSWDMYTATDPSASFTPGALAGDAVYTNAYGTWTLSMIVANTANTITAFSNNGGLAQGAYWIDPMKLNVTSPTLTAGALAGQSVRVNGTTFRVRSNTTSQIQLVPAFETLQPSVSEPGVTTYWLTGLPSGAIFAMADDRTGGFYCGTSGGLAHFSGTSWTGLSEAQTSTIHNSGTVSSFDPYDVFDETANYTPNALVGLRLKTSGGIYAISGNSQTEINLVNAMNEVSAPVFGETYQVLNGDGVVGTSQVLSVAGGSVFVGTGSGLSRETTGTWARFTNANTAGGLPDDTVVAMSAASATDVWTASGYGYGVGHLTGATWTDFNTSSTPGLLSDWITSIFAAPSGNIWFTTDNGLNELSSSTWTGYGTGTTGFPSDAQDVYVDPAGNVWIAAPEGLLKLTP